jgi:hypothetical protein
MVMWHLKVSDHDFNVSVLRHPAMSNGRQTKEGFYGGSEQSDAHW